ncbi:GNAT family N-acetyltransferase [Nocardia sp. NBC_00511]|uniref:GNAT family N-acetyltransferase n=1 Tax=Nocardia sp. NBC_00511 TaxID=2903591 RepID=UPI002F90A6EC
MLAHYRPDDIVVTTVRSADQVIAFTLALRHGDTLRQVWCGQTPEASGAYFVMNFPSARHVVPPSRRCRTRH